MVAIQIFNRRRWKRLSYRFWAGLIDPTCLIRLVGFSSKIFFSLPWKTHGKSLWQIVNLKFFLAILGKKKTQIITKHLNPPKILRKIPLLPFFVFTLKTITVWGEFKLVSGDYFIIFSDIKKQKKKNKRKEKVLKFDHKTFCWFIAESTIVEFVHLYYLNTKL